MEKFRKVFQERTKPQMNHATGEYKVDPFRDAQKILSESAFAKLEREQFFNDAYGNILTDLFSAWLVSPAHAVKEREYLYTVAMALGSVKDKLIRIETLGANATFVKQQKENDNDE